MKVSDIFKEITDKQLSEGFSDNVGVFFFKYSGVPTADLVKLRRNLRAIDSKMVVVKNNFVRFIIKKFKKGDDVLNFVDGPTALIFVKDDPVAPSKIITEFAKDHPLMELRGGYLNDRLLKAGDFKVLSAIPPLQVLYQQIAVGLNSPISKLAMNLNQIIAKLAYALKAVGEKKNC